MTERIAQPADDRLRIDKWLFAARFFKTRSLAAEAIDRGRVQINGIRAKPARILNTGDMLNIRVGPYHYQVKVMVLSNQRRSAIEARTLYQETEESRQVRETLAVSLRAQPASPRFAEKGRPTKRSRRDLERFMSGK